MRTLCLNLHKEENVSVAETFLPFSQRVKFRKPGYVFADISSAAKQYGGEHNLVEEVLEISQELFPQSSLAIANTPSVAQVLSNKNDIFVAKNEWDEISELPLSSLKDLEGLVAWSSVEEIEDIISFFNISGFEKIGELYPLDVSFFKENWGDTGSLLWKRLHGQDRQVITPLWPRPFLKEKIRLDFPVSLLPFLLHCIEKNLKFLFARLKARREQTDKILIHLYGEYKNGYHLIELSTNYPNQEIELYLKLLEAELLCLSLENPIREIEIEMSSQPEPKVQLDLLKGSSFKVEGTFSMEDENEELENNSLDDSWSSPALQPTQILDKPVALSSAELDRLHWINEAPFGYLENDDWQESRGRQYFFALSPEGETLWICQDKIEGQFFIHGYLNPLQND